MHYDYMTIRLFNTLSRSLEEFKPIKKRAIGLYACGPTVYNFAHVGNLRTYIFEDILKRTLVYNGYKVKHIMNITDVGHLTSDADSGEDKIEKEAAKEQKSAWEIAKFYTEAFHRDLKALNVLPADIEPRATDHIKEQIKLIKKLEKKGFTYKTVDGIYFDTSKLLSYGKLANLQNQELRAGVRVSVGDKKNPSDFALWKFSPPLTKRQMEWKSPWAMPDGRQGTGFPGWHIECSAMSVKYLGQPFDIHTGGIDHIPVHHTNEIAQSEAAEGKPLANYWLHGEFLVIDEQKMAKSAENFLTLKTITDRGISPIAYRYFLLQTHYRRQLNFSWEALEAAENGLNHLYASARSLTPPPPQRRGQGEDSPLTTQFLAHINSDLDLPGALALVWESLKNKTITLNELLDFDKVLGLRIKENLKVKEEPVPEKVQQIINNRDSARKSHDWGKSDALRQELENMGYEVKDTKEGTKVKRK